jgi:hypothetical protein
MTVQWNRGGACWRSNSTLHGVVLRKTPQVLGVAAFMKGFG